MARQPRSQQKTMANLPPDNAPAGSAGDRSRSSKDTASGQQRMRPQLWWLIILVVVTANYMMMRVFSPEPSSITVSYTFFKQQVEAGNVETVTSVGDSIRGSFKTEVNSRPQESQAP